MKLYSHRDTYINRTLNVCFINQSDAASITDNSKDQTVQYGKNTQIFCEIDAEPFTDSLCPTLS